MKYNQEVIRKNLHWLRIERGVNIKKFAELIGVSPSLVACWEAGTRNVTAEALNKASVALDLPVAYFLIDQTPKDVETATVAPESHSITSKFIDLTEILTDKTKLVWQDRVLSMDEKRRVYNIVFALLKET
ncbi:MAG: helix-turn-helix domain-containing protein [Turicibacter sp.]|nr:helix-turn-helix domain-containing protein [Turicibacter sp.]